MFIRIQTKNQITGMQIKPKHNKVLFFSDLHLGVHQNSSTWHKIALDVANWICSTMQEHDLDTIFFAGDLFHDRHEIGVNTLHAAKTFFDILGNYQIHLIPGNHDAFLSSTAEINSVEILARHNINVYSKPTTLTVSNKKVTFCPWRVDIAQLERADMIIGHFDINNFNVTHSQVCDHGHSSESLLDKAECIVSGHFHIREHRKYEEKYILYLGSPYEMDFGDRDQQKGVSIIDFTDLNSVEFVENNVTPKHLRIKVTDLVQKKYKNISELVKNNIVSLYVDTKFDALTLDLLITKLTQFGPLQFRTEFNVLETAQVDSKDVKKLSIDIETAFSEFVEHIETRASKKEVLDKCIELYKASQVSVD